MASSLLHLNGPDLGKEQRDSARVAGDHAVVYDLQGGLLGVFLDGSVLELQPLAAPGKLEGRPADLGDGKTDRLDLDRLDLGIGEAALRQGLGVGGPDGLGILDGLLDQLWLVAVGLVDSP